MEKEINKALKTVAFEQMSLGIINLSLICRTPIEFDHIKKLNKEIKFLKKLLEDKNE